MVDAPIAASVRRTRKRASGAIREGSGDMAFLVVVHVALALVLLTILYPLIFIVSSSFSSTSAVTSGRVWLWPVEPSLNGYRAVFSHQGVLRGYYNSACYSIAGTAISIVMTIIVAYPLSRKDFVGRGVITFIFVFTMFFNAVSFPRISS